MSELAPAKVNLCLFLGPTRPDGRHELVSVMQPLAFGDEVVAEPAEADAVLCPGVEGPNLAAAALRALRERVPAAPPLRLTIAKRIPVAAGLAGGSADAGAALRLAARAAGLDDDALLREVGATLGADVPAQVRPARVLATAAGEVLDELAPAPPFGVVVLPADAELSTADVYREADRLGLPRSAADLAERLEAVRAGLGEGPFGLAGELIANDLEPAARSLCPAVDAALAALRDAGARHALVSGSGPTAVGLFADAPAAERAAARLAGRRPAPIVTAPLPAGVPA